LEQGGEADWRFIMQPQGNIPIHNVQINHP
jgi:hypothetical protein